MDPLSAATTRSSHQQLRRRTSHHLIRTAHGHEAPQIHALLERAFVDERDYFAETLLDEVERSMAHAMNGSFSKRTVRRLVWCASTEIV